METNLDLIDDYTISYNEKTLSVKGFVAHDKMIFQLQYLETEEEYVMEIAINNNGKLTTPIEPEKVMRGGKEIAQLIMDHYK